ncbi:pyridine nucleotide-disulfide oxidoreductase [Planctomycetales bacterium]|nr:pyridine nucleotide-disulfide oxidoreductase [Planctomycetales bacterium]
MRFCISVVVIISTFLAAVQANEPVFIEAESFADKGGWVVDQQYMDVMGSPVLLAHGMGEPVKDATTTAVFPQPGQYRVFVRTRNWVAPWTPEYAPGKFQMSINGQKLDTVFGTEGDPWHWQSGGTVDIKDTNVKIALHDLTGFDGRLDAVIFTNDENYTPPEDVKAIDVIRRKALKLADSPLDAPLAKEGQFDLVVVGGGIAGICSSISAARLGCKVALIQNRPVLGGNNSSEVRVHLQGRMGYPPYPNLGNLVHELDPQHEGNAQPGEHYKDEKKINAVKGEKNITLYLNTHIIAAETDKAADGSITIKSVVGKNIETGTETKFVGKLFADCSGDGNLGFLTGAEWRMGRESKAETREDLAPENPDKMTMGASIQWYGVPATGADGKPVKTEFPPLPWAHQFTHESAQPMLHGDWDWETGLHYDQVWDAERIRDNGLRAAYGHWSYMKNQSTPEWREKADTQKLGWVAFVAGKRESRRLMGDIVLQEQDVVQREIYPDASFITTWTLDLHYPETKNEKFFSKEAFRTIAKHKHVQAYAVPYRTLYSKNVSNLFMAGRCISVTHVALGSIRVMRTGGMMGEVVGMATSLAVKNNTTPRGVYEKYLPELKQLMEKGVAPAVDKYWRSAQPQISLQLTPPAWLPKAGKNLAKDAAVKVSSSFTADFPPENVIDGVFNPNNNVGRWVSEIVTDFTKTPQWVELTFKEPVEVNALRLLTGQTGAGSPITDCVLQRKDGGKWIDVAGSKIEKNVAIDVSRTFAPVKSSAFRLWITGSIDKKARIWELELYNVK